ncbi:type IV pilus modification protein PilV [Chitiniphilus purpureus]|uniref:Type IV pilus modification protein PilV n=1 Tax=Chitiniphilus purpureus TaxID=2981137 RepID=A0ABY6DRE0_9NEIS|nr:type IV pilus modification protein PilV [Chitiniphilus sp. CD1]UXY15651.1 type IV pilus modification protein PilV [Chitiniphilus sp. CD1]
MRTNQLGIIMIEVLVSLAVLALGILGLASLQVYSLKNSQSAYSRSIASDLANDLADRIRANRSPRRSESDGGAAAYDENGAVIPLAPDYARLICAVDASAAGAITCSWPSGFTQPANTAGAALAAQDLAAWKNLVAASLPAGSEGGGVICRDNNLNNDPKNTPGAGTYTSKPVAPDHANFASLTGCLAPGSAGYATAPYVVKIWWQENVSSVERGDASSVNAKQQATLSLFSTPI